MWLPKLTQRGLCLGLEKSVGALSNFFEFGGDSIKAIRIITELRSRNITVSVADIMREKTVRAIAAVCLVNESAQISQEPFEGEIEDTPIVTFFKRLKLPVASHFNQSILVRCRQRADSVLLQKAVDALCLQHDLLRAVWSDEHLMVQGPYKSIEVEEYTEGKDGITGICNEIQCGIHMNEALIRIALIHGDSDDYVLMAAQMACPGALFQKILKGLMVRCLREMNRSFLQRQIPTRIMPGASALFGTAIAFRLRESIGMRLRRSSCPCL